MALVTTLTTVLLLLLSCAPQPADAAARARNMFRQNSSYNIEVDTNDWSNYDADGGGCVTCPYTCIKRSTGPTGTSLNLSNATLMASLPAIYSSTVKNGCCYAPKSKSKVMPSCDVEANPKEAEACGFLYGPTLRWRIDKALDPPTKAVQAILFASIDCENFWAVGATPIKYVTNTKAVKGFKQINGGCYGPATGSAMVLAGCLTYELKFDKSKTYTWDQLAVKCLGIAGKCVVTNGIWGKHLNCCMKPNGLSSDWDIKAQIYTTAPKTTITLSGPAIMGIVFGGVALMLCLVHFGAKIRQRAKQTALMREQEATDDYEEIMTPLTVGNNGGRRGGGHAMGPASMEVSLHEGDKIFRKPQEEVLYEGDMY